MRGIATIISIVGSMKDIELTEVPTNHQLAKWLDTHVGNIHLIDDFNCMRFDGAERATVAYTNKAATERDNGFNGVAAFLYRGALDREGKSDVSDDLYGPVVIFHGDMEFMLGLLNVTGFTNQKERVLAIEGGLLS